VGPVRATERAGGTLDARALPPLTTLGARALLLAGARPVAAPVGVAVAAPELLPPVGVPPFAAAPSRRSARGGIAVGGKRPVPFGAGADGDAPTLCME
jgi:hypothetical protein